MVFVGPEAERQKVVPEIEKVNKIPDDAGAYWVEAGDIEESRVLSGEVGAESGAAAYSSLSRAVELVEDLKASGLITLPLVKAAVQESGQKKFTGHTEFLENYWEQKAVMTFLGDELNVALLTRHIPLREVADKISIQLVEEVVDKLVDFFVAYLDRPPKIALLGLNPHAGEEGLIGAGEKNILQPAVEKLVEAGVDIEGPFPADSYFPVHSNRHDLVLSPYHDQGLLPFKQRYFFTGIQASVGLPYPRVSPDHGAAAEIAGKGQIDPRSAINCMKQLRRRAEEE